MDCIYCNNTTINNRNTDFKCKNCNVDYHAVGQPDFYSINLNFPDGKICIFPNQKRISYWYKKVWIRAESLKYISPADAQWYYNRVKNLKAFL